MPEAGAKAWEGLPENIRIALAAKFEAEIDEMIADAAYAYDLPIEHVEACFADWVITGGRV